MKKKFEIIICGLLVLILVFFSGCGTGSIELMGNGTLKEVTYDGDNMVQTITLDGKTYNVYSHVWFMDKDFEVIDSYNIGEKYWMYKVHRDLSFSSGTALIPKEVSSFDEYKNGINKAGSK